VPELPEVEAVARTARPLLIGRLIKRCEVIHAIAVRPQKPAAIAAAVKGRTIVRIERRGKYLLLGLDRGWLVIHFRLDGQLLWLPPRSGGAARRKYTAPHVCLRLELSGNPAGSLGFVDRRHFGRALFFSALDQAPGLRALGSEPLLREFTAARLAALLRASRRPVKLLLMDQTRIAGLGNIYSSEALWRARISPRRRAHRVEPEEARALHKAIVGVLRAALECCLTPAPDFRDPAWWFQGLEALLRVYGREGKPCRRCTTGIRRIEQGGRASFFCPRCQT
jgi:formamidopyrimidine-DNA glycosylase